MAGVSLTLFMTLLDDGYYLPEWSECARRLAPDEIVVVDGGSEDGGPEFLLEQDLAGFRLFRRPMEAINWHHGNQLNFGADQARGDWILLLDADEVLWPPDRRLLEEAIRRAGDDIVSLWFARFQLWSDDRTRVDWGEDLDQQGRLWKRDAGIRRVRVIHTLQKLNGGIIGYDHPRAELVELPVILHRKLASPYEVRVARHRRWIEHFAEVSAAEGHLIPRRMPDYYGPTLPLPDDVAQWREKLMERHATEAQRQ